jgi:hypothetical protein
MAYSIILTSTARQHLRYLLRQGVMSRGEHVRLINAISSRLTYQPTVAQGSVKLLRQPNMLDTAFELSVKPWRVLYDVDEGLAEVRVKAVGWKIREKLFVEGQEVEL